MPLYMLGFMGATRRLDHYDAATGGIRYSSSSALEPSSSCAVLFVQFFGLFWSIYKRKQNWDQYRRRPLEWTYVGMVDIIAATHLQLCHRPDSGPARSLWAKKRGQAPQRKSMKISPCPKIPPWGSISEFSACSSALP